MDSDIVFVNNLLQMDSDTVFVNNLLNVAHSQNVSHTHTYYQI